MFLGFGNQLSWLLCCGVGITVQYLLNLLCCIIWWLHLSPTRLHQIEHYKKKSVHSDWSITHLLFAHGWMVMKASTCSKPCAPFSTWLQHVFFLPHGLHAKKGKISKYNYTACNHSSVKGQQRLLSISLTHNYVPAMWSICVMYKLVVLDSLKSVQIMWNHYPLTVVLFSLYIYCTRGSKCFC